MPRLIAAGLALALAAFPARAHHASASFEATSLEWLAIALLAASVLLYALGVAKLWSRAGAGRGVTLGEAARFAIGWLVLAVALLSPLDSWGERLFWVHMVQHELLMVAAAPLLASSRAVEAWTWAFSPGWRARLGAIARAEGIRRTWNAITDPMGAWMLHAIALWAWHVPALFEAASASPAVHALQHASFLGTALLFWSSVLPPASRRHPGAALASLFTTMMHSAALGALLTFAAVAWYPRYAQGIASGLTGLEDQQLGGLIMWGPAGLAYLAAALVIALRWLSPPRRRTAGSCAATSPPSC